MTNLNVKLPTKADVKTLPKNQTLDAVIIDVEIKTWREIIADNTKLLKFENPDQQMIVVKYDVQGIILSETFPYNENPSDRSKLGRFLNRYEDIQVGNKILVDFDAESKANILLAK